MPPEMIDLDKMDNFVYPVRPASASKIHGNIWMGGWIPPGFHVGAYFDCVVLCATEYQIPDCFIDVKVHQVLLKDDGSKMTKKEAFDAVGAAKKVIDWDKQNLKILVTCFAGRNRSGLVTAIALCKGQYNMSLLKATELIRSVRPNALVNPYFNEFLSKFCP